MPKNAWLRKRVKIIEPATDELIVKVFIVYYRKYEKLCQLRGGSSHDAPLPYLWGYPRNQWEDWLRADRTLSQLGHHWWEVGSRLSVGKTIPAFDENGFSTKELRGMSNAEAINTDKHFVKFKYLKATPEFYSDNSCTVKIVSL